MIQTAKTRNNNSIDFNIGPTTLTLNWSCQTRRAEVKHFKNKKETNYHSNPNFRFPVFLLHPLHEWILTDAETAFRKKGLDPLFTLCEIAWFGGMRKPFCIRHHGGVEPFPSTWKKSRIGLTSLGNRVQKKIIVIIKTVMFLTAFP